MARIKIPYSVGLLIDYLRRVPGVPNKTPLEIRCSFPGLLSFGSREFTVRWERGIVATGRVTFYTNGMVKIERVFIQRNFSDLQIDMNGPDRWLDQISPGMLDPSERDKSWIRETTSDGYRLSVEMKIPEEPAA